MLPFRVVDIYIKLLKTHYRDAIPDDRPMKEKLYDTLPRSLKAEVLVRVRDEDPEIQMERQELTRAKSPVELSKISSFSEFPVPKNIENILTKSKRGKF